MPPQPKYKVVLLGKESVGKTSLVVRYVYDAFDTRTEATIGVDFLSKPQKIGDKTVLLQIWDTAGQERFRSLIPSYVRDCYVGLLVFDLSDPKSLDEIPTWLDFVRSNKDAPAIVLVGNKADLKEKKTVEETRERAKGLAKKEKIEYYEASAKTGENVEEMFVGILRENPLKNGRIEPELDQGVGDIQQGNCWC